MEKSLITPSSFEHLKLVNKIYAEKYGYKHISDMPSKVGSKELYSQLFKLSYAELNKIYRG